MTYEAGRAFDLEVGEEVMRWRLDDGDWIGPDGQYTGWKDPEDPSRHAWKPSTEMGPAWELVQRIQRMFSANFELTCPDHSRPEPWTVIFRSRTYGPEVTAMGPTAALAICRAAIQAVKESE